MEQLLHYVWRHKILPLHELRTTDGRVVEVVNPGIYNHDAGPDFFNAKVKIDGQLWVGNVEIHIHSSDWRRHHHDNDEAYQNVILHVVNEADCEVCYPHDPDKKIPQLVLEVPDYVLQNYDELARSDVQPRCKNVVATLPRLMVNSWLSALQIERLEERTLQIMARREQCDKNWEYTFFVTMARNFGFGINGDAFETWARTVPLSAVGKHRDSLFQIEAIFFGQAGLLDELCPKSAPEDTYFQQLQREYRYLQKKFQTTMPLHPIDYTAWRFLRLRPQNFPHIRIAQLAMLYHEGRLNLSRIVEQANSLSADRFNFDIDRQSGELPAGSPEGRLKAIVTNEAMSAPEKELYQDIKDIFDPNGILNPDVKLGANSKFTLTHFRNEPSPRLVM